MEVLITLKNLGIPPSYRNIKLYARLEVAKLTYVPPPLLKLKCKMKQL